MSYTLHDIPSSERPRERLIRFGSESLSNTELVSILLGTGMAGQSVVRIAQKVLKYFDDIVGLSEASFEDLKNQPGIGPAKACLLLACFELSRRTNLQSGYNRIVSSPLEAARTARLLLKDLHKEQSLVLSFDVRNRLIKADELSVGTLTTSLVHPREVFGIAIKRHAASIMLCHNHPSGDTAPSEQDIDISQRLSTAGEILGIPLLDHIIVTRTKHLSLREMGLL